jgi:hypothetical protein
MITHKSLTRVSKSDIVLLVLSIKPKYTNMKTDYITLTELWQDGEYNMVGNIIHAEDWSRTRLAEFCSYFAKFLGQRELDLLHKFI